MMKHIEITKADINGNETNAVLLRDLHKSLGVKTEFANWLKDQKEVLENYEEGEDYIRTTKDKKGVTLIVKSGLKLQGKQSEYIISLDMAKHLSMLSRTKKGREVRKYFIDIEKEHNNKSIKSLTDQLNKTQALFHTQEVMGEVVTEHDKRIKNLELNTRIENWQQKALLDAKNRKVYELANDDEKLIRKLHMKAWQLFKKRFNIPRYDEIRVGQYEDGLMYIDGLKMSDMVA